MGDLHRSKVQEFLRKHRIGLLTLLFTDIVGSTKLKQVLGDAAAAMHITQHHLLLRDLLKGFSEAEEIDRSGDSFFVIFARPSDALRFALCLQSRLRVLAQESGVSILDRVGIHVGEVVIDETGLGDGGKDLYGIQVDNCARIMSLAEGDQILMSRVVLFQLLIGDCSQPVTTDWAADIPDPLLRDDLQHCFAGNPQDRFAGAGQLAKNLRALPQRRSAFAEHQAELAARERAAYRRGIVRSAGIAATIVLGVAGLAGFALNQSRQAKAKAAELRRESYAADMRVASIALEEHNFSRALELVQKYAPKPGEEDLRTFEWRYLWQLCRGDEISSLPSHQDTASAVAFSRDSQFLATAGFDGVIRIWDFVLQKPITDLDGLNGRFLLGSIAFSPDGKMLAAATQDSSPDEQLEIVLVNLTTGKVEARLPDAGSPFAFSANSRWLAAGSSRPGNSIKLWDATSHKERTTLASDKTWWGRSSLIDFSPDSNVLALSSNFDHTVTFWEVPSGKHLRTLKGHSEGVTGMDFSPDGRTLATAGNDKTIRFWNVATGQETLVFKDYLANFPTVNFAPDGNAVVASINTDGVVPQPVQLWRAPSLAEIEQAEAKDKAEGKQP